MENLDHITQLKLSANDFIFRENDPPDGYMYFIFNGKINFQRTRNDKSYLVNSAGPGEFFGEMAIVSKHPRALCAQVASQKAHLGRIDRIAFLGICKKNPMFTYKLIKSVVERLGNAEGKIHRLLEEFEEDLEMHQRALELNLLPVSLPPLDILNFVNNVPTRMHLRGEYVLREGEKTDGSIYFLFAGELLIVKGPDENHEIIRSLQPGEFFGEISMISHKPFMASVIVESATARIARLDEKIFVRISRNSPEFLFLILQNMIGKLSQREDLIDRFMILQSGGEPVQYGVPVEEENPEEANPDGNNLDATNQSEKKPEEEIEKSSEKKTE